MTNYKLGEYIALKIEQFFQFYVPTYGGTELESCERFVHHTFYLGVPHNISCVRIRYNDAYFPKDVKEDELILAEPVRNQNPCWDAGKKKWKDQYGNALVLD